MLFAEGFGGLFIAETAGSLRALDAFWRAYSILRPLQPGQACQGKLRDGWKGNFPSEAERRVGSKCGGRNDAAQLGPAIVGGIQTGLSWQRETPQCANY
jgi:hypothetical protein